MNVLIDVYDSERDQHQYRHYLEEHILKHYDEMITSVRPEYHGYRLLLASNVFLKNHFLPVFII